MDKSFEGLLISIVLHVALIVFLFKADLRPHVTPSETTEITLIENSSDQGGYIVPETEKEQREELKDLKDAAQILSQFTKRVKQQLIARQKGLNVNSRPSRSKSAGTQQDTSIPLPETDGSGLRRRENPIRNMAIGGGSMAEYIPGIQEGYFTALNTDQFIYTIFYERIHIQVRPRWVNNVRNYMGKLSPEKLKKLAERNRTTVFEVILGPDGSYFTSLVHRSSGDEELDRVTLQAFREAAPFPNPPRGMIDKDGLIHLYYAFTISFRPTFGPAG